MLDTIADIAAAIAGALLLSVGTAAVLILVGGYEVPMVAVVLGAICGLVGALVGLYTRDVFRKY